VVVAGTILFLVEVTMDNQNNNGMMDKKTLLAAALAMAFIFAWQSYLNNKYGKQNAQNPAAATQEAGKTEASGETPAVQTAPAATPAVAATTALATNAASEAQKPEQTYKYDSKIASFEISSRGMGVKHLFLKENTDRNHEALKMGVSEQHGLYEMAVVGATAPLDFAVTQKSDNEFEGTAKYGNATIHRKMMIDADTTAMTNAVFVEGVDASFPGLTVSIAEKSLGEISQSMFMPSFEVQDFVVVHSGNEERIHSSASKEKIEKSFPGVSLIGIGSQYFASSLLDKSEITPEAKILGGAAVPELVAQLAYKPAINSKNTMELKWISYSGGKSLTTLEKVDKDLARVLDLGFFATLGRWLLYTMQWFHSKIPNWGVAIILLTLLVRLIVLPLNVTTFRSTKKMQKIQPLIASLRERYKDDPQAMNREMMGLWKEHKVNPLGGCLPMLLQLPIFFALYRVLGQSIELYQAPFFGWIHDLSLKDPFYVLPVLMAVCMFIQQKITPTTMDPTQAKVMQFLPLIFALMMVNLPAGLTLYIFINTLSGILLQQIFMHDRANASTAKAAKA
jgi:YidC/Oxa1 family membrane protein insertase